MQELAPWNAGKKGSLRMPSCKCLGWVGMLEEMQVLGRLEVRVGGMRQG